MSFCWRATDGSEPSAAAESQAACQAEAGR